MAQQRDEIVGERGIHIVGQDDQIRAFFDDFGDVMQCLVIDLHGRRIARIDQEERLDLGIQQLVELLVRELPFVGLRRIDRQQHQVVVAQLRDFDVRGEDRHAERNGVSGADDVVGLQAGEQIGHGRRPAFQRVHVEVADEGVGANHFFMDVIADDDLAHHQHAVGHRVIAAKNRLAHFIDEVARIEPHLVANIRHRRFDETHAGNAFMLFGEQLEARLDPLSFRKAADMLHVHVGAFGFGHGKQAELEKTMAWRGRQEVGVATSSVQHQLVALGCTLHQGVFQFERAQQRKFVRVAKIHLASP